MVEGASKDADKPCPASLLTREDQGPVSPPTPLSFRFHNLK